MAKDTYVDDCLSGAESEEKAAQKAENMHTSIKRGGFEYKGIAFSGKDPPETMSDDGATVSVAGYK